MKKIESISRIIIWISFNVFNIFVLNTIMFTLINFALYTTNEINPKTIWYPLSRFLQIYLFILSFAVLYFTYVIYIKPCMKKVSKT